MGADPNRWPRLRDFGLVPGAEYPPVRAVDGGTAILFAQFSMERILPASAAAHPAPVAGPATGGVLRLRELLTGR